jgi:hypothetical protein
MSNHATLTPDNSGNLKFKFSYDAGLIAALKEAIPYTDRAWEPLEKVWIIAPKHADLLVKLAALFLEAYITKPILSNKPQTIQTQSLKVEYLGSAKDRGNGEITATGWSNGSWSVIFPLDVLKAWFDPDNVGRPSEATTLYSILGLSSKTTQEELKKAYRRLARQWHPDVCREVDAVQQFQRLQNAYEILSDEVKRKKYNAGLRLEASLSVAHQNQSSVYMVDAVYRSPLRCGWILAKGEQVLNRFVVKKILAWEDITQAGLTMVSSWENGNDKFTIEWV